MSTVIAPVAWYRSRGRDRPTLERIITGEDLQGVVAIEPLDRVDDRGEPTSLSSLASPTIGAGLHKGKVEGHEAADVTLFSVSVLPPPKLMSVLGRSGSRSPGRRRGSKMPVTPVRSILSPWPRLKSMTCRRRSRWRRQRCRRRRRRSARSLPPRPSSRSLPFWPSRMLLLRIARDRVVEVGAAHAADAPVKVSVPTELSPVAVPGRQDRPSRRAVALRS